MHSFKGSTFGNNYSLARDLVTIPLMACPQLFSLKHQNTTMVSKAHAKIKRLCCWQCQKSTLFNGKAKVKCSSKTRSTSFAGVDVGAGMLTGSVMSVCRAPLALFALDTHGRTGICLSESSNEMTTVTAKCHFARVH